MPLSFLAPFAERHRGQGQEYFAIGAKVTKKLGATADALDLQPSQQHDFRARGGLDAGVWEREGERTDTLPTRALRWLVLPQRPFLGGHIGLHAAVHVRWQNRVVRGRERARATRQLCALRKKGPLP